MNIKNTLRPLMMAMSLASAQAAFAGEFSVSCSYTNDNLSKCASNISDIVSDKFIAKFPATQFAIFVHSYASSFTNGGFSTYAVAGVIKKNSGQFPNRTFSSVMVNSNDKEVGRIELAKKELENYRSAVQYLMDACELSPNCDIYSAK